MQLEQEERGEGETDNLGRDVNQMEALGGMLEEGSLIASLVKWINSVIPHLNLPPETSKEELRALLSDGSALCIILDKLVPGFVEIGSGSPDEPVDVKKFLAAMDELGLPRFNFSDLEQGSVVPVLQKHIQSSSRKRWDPSGIGSLQETDCCLKDVSKFRDASGNEERLKISVFQHFSEGSILSDAGPSVNYIGSKSNELFQLKQGSHVDVYYAKIKELPSNSLDSASTQSLFYIGNRILGDIFERKNGDVPHRAACLLSKILQVIQWRFSNQAENLKNQNNLLKAREGKYQSRINALETLVVGTTEENKVVTSSFQQLKLEKIKLEKRKFEEQDVAQLKSDKIRGELEISSLKQELETAKRAHEEHCSQLELDINESKADYEKKIGELECHLASARKQVKELKAFLKSRSSKWKGKEHTYRSFLNDQFGAFQQVRAVMESVKQELLKTKRSYSEEFKYLGMKLKGVAEAAENYHEVLKENRKLYNEVQDLKGNIRVYCRIRPFLPGQSQRHTTIEFIGDNGELIVSNPLKLGKESKLFKFNKVFGPAASQEEVYMDTQPLIRSVLDGYSVCIFAYGQTGSGKTYTMSGPSLASQSDWGVNYRALHDLFQMSQSRRGSIIYEVGVQMVEIYNEQVRDLLSSNGPQKRIGIWNASQPNGLAVPDASMYSVNSMTDVLQLLNIGMMNRATSDTALNERSSRSHSVLTVHARGKDLKANALLRGCLHLVDLAGSERVNRSEATGDRLKEAQHINKSLSALGDVIFALAQKSRHVPYRNSKLTQLLQSSLGGQAKTLMFVQLNPDAASYPETISTLEFAKRVSGVELGAARSNKEGKHVRQLMEQLTSLKDAIARKDEEIERLQLLNANHDVSKHSMTSLDNCSEYNEKHPEPGSTYPMDYSRNKPGSLQLKSARDDISENSNEVELLGSRDANSEERLRDISDGELSLGSETAGSINSIVEYTLCPESEKPAEVTPAKITTENIPAENAQKFIMTLPSKIYQAPQVPQKVQMKSSRLSLNRSSSKAFSSVRKTKAGSSSSLKPPNR